MIDPPKTKDEAARYRYGGWGVNMWHNPGRCAYEVARPSSFVFYQCSRRAGHGPDNLYCKQHAKMVDGGSND